MLVDKKSSGVLLEFLLKETKHAGGRSNDKRLQRFFTWMYVVVDDIWLEIAPFFKRTGPAPECPDNQLLAMALIGECRGWDLETEMLSQWQEHRDLFPVIPSQSRFNRRRRGLLQAFNLIIISYSSKENNTASEWPRLTIAYVTPTSTPTP